MLKRFRWFRGRAFFKAERGATLTEVVIAIVVIGFVVASVPAAMMAIHNAQFRQDELRIAESLTRNQFEYIKSQDYIWGNTTHTYPPVYDEVNPPLGSYFMDVMAYPIDPVTYARLDPAGKGYVDDGGLQEIVITVYGFRTRATQSGEYLPVIETKNYRAAY